MDTLIPVKALVETAEVAGRLGQWLASKNLSPTSVGGVQGVFNANMSRERRAARATVAVVPSLPNFEITLVMEPLEPPEPPGRWNPFRRQGIYTARIEAMGRPFTSACGDNDVDGHSSANEALNCVWRKVVVRTSQIVQELSALEIA